MSWGEPRGPQVGDHYLPVTSIRDEAAIVIRTALIARGRDAIFQVDHDAQTVAEALDKAGLLVTQRRTLG